MRCPLHSRFERKPSKQLCKVFAALLDLAALFCLSVFKVKHLSVNHMQGTLPYQVSFITADAAGRELRTVGIGLTSFINCC